MIIFLKQQSFLFWLGISILGAIILFTLAAPLLIHYDPDLQNDPSQNSYQPPSGNHWFGTDQFGRDLFARVLYGGRISLLVALSVVLFAIIIGSCYGALAGYFGGIPDQFLMRIVDLFLSFPIIFLTVTCMALFGTGVLILIIILTLTSWLDIARLVRAEVHGLKQQPFILRAKAAGLKKSRILFSHLLPNVLITVLAFAVIRFADIILIESALSFIGLGVQPPTASWGSIINDGKVMMSAAWWVTLFPGLAILLTTFSLNLIGNGIKSLQDE